MAKKTIAKTIAMPQHIKCDTCGTALTFEEWIEDGQRAVDMDEDAFGRKAFCRACTEAQYEPDSYDPMAVLLALARWEIATLLGKQ